ncbi:hypothetical protein MD484_g4530, partial [Candolleomyces efflorescens]
MQFSWFTIVSATIGAVVTCAQAAHLTNPTIGAATDVVWTVRPTDNATTDLVITLGLTNDPFSARHLWHIPDARAGVLPVVLDSPHLTAGTDYILRVFEIRPDIFDWVREFSDVFQLKAPAASG